MVNFQLIVSILVFSPSLSSRLQPYRQCGLLGFVIDFLSNDAKDEIEKKIVLCVHSNKKVQ